MKVTSVIAWFAIAVSAAFAQDKPADKPAAEKRLEFEVASVKPAAPMVPGQVHIGVHIDGSQFTSSYLSLRDYIRTAYQVKDPQIVGPDWMASERYDISAKLPSAEDRPKVRDMLQALLAERFKLVFHRETRELPVYALVVLKGGTKLKESALDPEPEGDGAGRGAVNVSAEGGRGGTVVNFGRGSYINFGFLKVEARKVSMANMVESLGRFVDRPVVDMTELKGTYDLDLEYSMDELKALIRASGSPVPPLPEVPDGGVSIMTSLQSVGLKLEARKAPMEILVIDRAEKNPTAN
jgi:uncharacterized protein (TIGR03435 family)